jgi:predicted membrane GTPase involved in stress response
MVLMRMGGVQALQMESRYTLERICSHRSEDTQLMFALRAIELLPSRLDYAVGACKEGLIVCGETESALDRPVELLKAIYGESLCVGTLAIRYRRRGTVIEEPYVGVRVRCDARYYGAVRDDLVARGGAVIDSEVTPLLAVLRATAPLARMLGYAQRLSDLTRGSGREVIWFSHYAQNDATGADVTENVEARQ